MAELKKVYCKNCNKPLYRSVGRFNENTKLNHNFYCSRGCEYKYKTKRKTLICENCGKKFERQPHSISPHNYCSQSCAAIGNNKKRPERGAKTIKCKSCGKKFKRWVVGNKIYCSIKCRKNEEYYRLEELLEIIKNKSKKLKRVPAKREFIEGIDKACVRFFGSWNNAVSAAGLIPNRSHNNRMYRRMSGKALDGHLCDSVSEILIDNWLYKNDIPHSKDVPYPETRYKADWKISLGNREVVIEYFGLANDSPRYDRSITRKKMLCKKLDISLIGIYPKDIYPKRYFEGNLKNKFKEFLNT